MPTTYTNGLKLPDLGSIDWYNSYKNNIDILDPIVGTVNGVATTYAPISHNHDASEITSGTIDIARLPPAALERLTTVADQTARYALTTSTVQLGDTVKQLDTGIMYLVVDTTKLNSADGYVEYSAGTASKAIADEDGTSIKTGYVNVAGDQTVSGQKTWRDNQFFTSAVYHKNTAYEIGNIPASNIVTNIYFADKNSVYTGFARNVIYSSGRSATEIRAKNAFKNGVLDPTGSDINSNLNVEVQPDGSKTIYWDGLIRNNVLPYTTNTYSLGSSSYQWSAVYAQSYYYNGTQWGLDKANVWTGNNEYKYLIGLSGGEIWFKHPNIEDITTNPNTDISKAILQIWNKGVTQYFGGITDSLLTDGTHRFTILCFGFPLNNYGGYYPHSFFFDAKRDGTASFSPSYTNASLGTSSYQWSSVYAQTYFYNGTAWGLDKANVWTGSNRFRNFGVQSANTIDITQSTYANSQNCGGIGFSDAVNRFWGDIELNVKTDAASEMVFNLSNWKADGSQGVTALRFRYDKTLTTVDFFGADRVVNLGTSTNKWKTLNGINPGALSLPKNSNSASFNIDTTNWTTDGSIIVYTPLLDGWIYINVRNDDTNGDSFIIFDDGVSGFGTSVFGNKGLQNNGVGLLCLMMPVNKNNHINIRIKSPGIISARLYPCLGNV